MKPIDSKMPNCNELNPMDSDSDRTLMSSAARYTMPYVLDSNSFSSTYALKRLVRKSLSSSLILIASQSYQVLGQSPLLEPPKWRSRSEMQSPVHELIADRNSGTQASPSQGPSNHTSRYRDLPNSPWERSSPSLDGVRNDLTHSNATSQPVSPRSEMIRQPSSSPSASRGRSNRGYNANHLSPASSPYPTAQPLPSGLPDRNDLNPGSDVQRDGAQMTLDLSNYQKPSPTSMFDGSRPGTQRLPFSGVPLSTTLDETSIGLGYPETVRNVGVSDTKVNPTADQMIRQPTYRQTSIPSNYPGRLQPALRPFDAAPREAIRDLPVTTGALRKAAQLNERSFEREARSQSYTQLPSVIATRTGQQLGSNPLKALSTAYETEASSRSNVIGVIGVIGVSPLTTSKPLQSNQLQSISEDAFPYSTDSSNDINVVPASVGVNHDVRDIQSLNHPTLSQPSLNQQVRMKTAGRISAELLDGSEDPLARTPLPVERPAGWNSLKDSLQGHLARCDDLLRRGAILSAREEVLMGMRSLARSLDLRSGTYGSEPAMEQALAAFSEESDFYRSSSSPAAGLATAMIVNGHKTKALKHTQLEDVSPDLAAQHYRSYARHQWLEAFQGHPWTSDLLYAYGKTLEREADQKAPNSVMYRNQAIVCYQAAMDVDPKHADNANQLGYALLQLDRVDEAQMALNQSVQVKPNSQAWSNLAEVHRRRGQADQVAFAQRKSLELNKAVAPEMVGVPEVIELDVKTFASVSPYPTGMQPPMHHGIPASGISAQQPATVQQASASVPRAKTSWFGNLFR